MTRRLYHEDATLRRFTGAVLAHATVQDAPAIVLDRTAFYPEAGGQLGDHGTVGGIAIVDTQELDDGRIAHVVAEGTALPSIGSEVSGEIEWMRRRQHMAQHTAQHLLSGALLDRAQAPTVSARLGESALTIDVSRDRVPEAELAAAEDLANDIIDDDLAVRQWFPDAGELAAIKLRRDPKVTADIRVVSIGDFDFSPCGGTHVARTSQIGAVRITSVERYKGMTRVTFTAARRGRTELFAREGVLRQLATLYSCAPADVPAAVEKAKKAGDATAAELTAMRGKLAQVMVDSYLASGANPVVAALPVDVEVLRAVAAKLSNAGRDAIVCAPDETGAAVVLFRAPGSALDCGALWKKLAATLGGRGGGKAERAEGRLQSPVTDWSNLVTEARS
ncbi:MAG TPA: alanine--tRNA ligase-related protein [Kofleriaceae bacterium]|jgi:alanyl-tRNA synthetase